MWSRTTLQCNTPLFFFLPLIYLFNISDGQFHPEIFWLAFPSFRTRHRSHDYLSIISIYGHVVHLFYIDPVSKPRYIESAIGYSCWCSTVRSVFSFFYCIYKSFRCSILGFWVKILFAHNAALMECNFLSQRKYICAFTYQGWCTCVFIDQDGYAFVHFRTEKPNIYIILFSVLYAALIQREDDRNILCSCSFRCVNCKNSIYFERKQKCRTIYRKTELAVHIARHITLDSACLWILTAKARCYMFSSWRWNNEMHSFINTSFAPGSRTPFNLQVYVVHNVTLGLYVIFRLSIASRYIKVCRHSKVWTGLVW